MEEYIQNIWLFLCLECQKQQLLVVLFVNQSFFEGKMILQILRHHQRASDNQYEHSYTGQPRYLKVQGNGGNTSRYPKFDIAKM